MDQWAELSKKKRKVHVFLSLGTSKDVQEACREHRQLTRIMVRNQLCTAASSFAWDGVLSGAAEQILLLHRGHTSLDEQHALLGRLLRPPRAQSLQFQGAGSCASQTSPTAIKRRKKFWRKRGWTFNVIFWECKLIIFSSQGSFGAPRILWSQIVWISAEVFLILVKIVEKLLMCS